jgi:hypothetical protein
MSYAYLNPSQADDQLNGFNSISLLLLVPIGLMLSQGKIVVKIVWVYDLTKVNILNV